MMVDRINALASPSSTDPRDKSFVGTLQSDHADFDTEPSRHLLGRNKDYAVTLAEPGKPDRTVYVSAGDAATLRDLKARNYSLDANPGMGGIQGRVTSIASTPTPITNTDLF